MDLNQLIALSNQHTAQGKQLLSGINTQYGKAIAETQGMADATLRVGANNAIIKEQEAAGKLEAQTQSRRMATAAGTNLSDNSEVLTFLAQQAKNSAMEVAQRTARVEKIAEGATLSNPLGLVYDLLFGDGERNALKASQDTLDSASQSIQKLNQATQTSAQTQVAIAETMSDASVAADVQNQLDLAEVAAAEQRVKMASLNIDMLNNINKFSGQELDNAFRINSASESAAQRAFMNEQRKAMREEQAAKQKDMNMMMADYNAGAKALGRAPVTNIHEFQYRLKAKDAGIIIDKGYEINATGKLSFGNTPVESLAMLATYKVELPPTQKRVVSQMEAWGAEFVNNPVAALADSGLVPSNADAMRLWNDAKKPEEKQALQNAYMEKKFRQEADNLNPANPTGMLALPPIDDLQGMQFLEGNKFLSEVVKPLVDAGGGVAFAPGEYIALVADRMMDGEFSTSEVAAGLGEMSRALYLKGPGSTGLTSTFGLPELGAYNAPVTAKTNELISDGTNWLSAGVTNQYSRKINYWDDAEWNSYLADYASKHLSRGALGKLNKRVADRVRSLNNVQY